MYTIVHLAKELHMIGLHTDPNTTLGLNYCSKIQYFYTQLACKTYNFKMIISVSEKGDRGQIVIPAKYTAVMNTATRLHIVFLLVIQYSTNTVCALVVESYCIMHEQRCTYL